MKTRQIHAVVDAMCFSDHKMAFVSGPRQCGKTTLARMVCDEHGHGAYWNWDDVVFRRIWTKDPQGCIPSSRVGVVPVVVLDEIHKAKGWKRSLKGLFDTLPAPADILVTGSARLNVYRKGGDSLLGRYYHFRLHPFSLSEMQDSAFPLPFDVDPMLKDLPTSSSRDGACLQQLMQFGTFPEPLFAQNTRKAKLWRRTRRERVIREDLRDLTRTLELSQIEMLASLIPERVGSPVSTACFRDLLEVSHTTTSRWLNWLKELYYIFEVKPYATHVSRSLKKEGKFYMWDPSEVDDEAARFENLIACHLLKACHMWTDAGEGTFELRYLRNKDGHEIDFLVLRDGTPWLPVEVKLTAKDPSPNWRRFLPGLPCRTGVQVCRQSGVRGLFRDRGRILIVTSAPDLLRLLP